MKRLYTVLFDDGIVEQAWSSKKCEIIIEKKRKQNIKVVKLYIE